MKSIELLRQRIVLAENKFAELVLWRLTQPLTDLDMLLSIVLPMWLMGNVFFGMITRQEKVIIGIGGEGNRIHVLHPEKLLDISNMISRGGTMKTVILDVRY